MDPQERREHQEFENEVRRIARELWPSAQFSGAKIEDGKQRDGIFDTEDCIHLVEATVSRAKDKAHERIKKLVTLAHRLQAAEPTKAVKCWFVTKHEPTADQRAEAQKHQKLVNAVSFSQFQSRLVDAAAYLAARDNYPFGSVRDPATGQATAELTYIDLDLKELGTERLWALRDVRTEMMNGQRFVILGDYGAGKSMSLRELYRDLRARYHQNKSRQFPVYLNLRDHHGQRDPAEVLERHARNIGFSPSHHLVRAWRSGYVLLLLDGFDEIATLGIQGLWRRLQDSRYRAVEAVRKFVREHPTGVGLALSGRAHFFDSDRERRHALAISTGFSELSLNEFSDEQVRRYLSTAGYTGKVPGWLPSRPLLLGYLATSGLLRELLVTAQESAPSASGSDPSAGWDLMIDRVCQRESEIEPGIDGPTIRQILERLATYARSTNAGLGPLSRDRVIEGFVDICGYHPDEKALVLLQRLPGLGIERPDEGNRIFIDEDLVDALRAGDVVRFVTDPYNSDRRIFHGAEHGLNALGIALGSIKLKALQIVHGALNAALRKAQEAHDVDMLVYDILRISIESAAAIEKPIVIANVIVPELEIDREDADCSKVTFRNCWFSRLAIDSEVPTHHLPGFESCVFVEIDGPASSKDLPSDRFDESCEFEQFVGAMETTSAIVHSELPLGVRVMLTVLRKVFLQKGAGRKENALHRGLDHSGRRLVPEVLRMLQREGLIIPYRRAGLSMTIWLPERASRGRVAAMIASPHVSNDPLLALAAELG